MFENWLNNLSANISTTQMGVLVDFRLFVISVNIDVT